MDTFRYGLALALVCTLPPFLLYWPVVHGGIEFWRRRGPTVTYTVVLGATLVGVAAFCHLRAHLLLVDYGTHWGLFAAGVVVAGLGVWLRVRIHRVFPNTTLLGLPELDPDQHPQALVRSGIYSRIRHPRYSQFVLVLAGFALITNYLGVYLVWLLWLPGVYVIVLFEEHELRKRFGAEYELYCQQVPRFFPKLGAVERGDSN